MFSVSLLVVSNALSFANILESHLAVISDSSVLHLPNCFQYVDDSKKYYDAL